MGEINIKLVIENTMVIQNLSCYTIVIIIKSTELIYFIFPNGFYLSHLIKSLDNPNALLKYSLSPFKNLLRSLAAFISSVCFLSLMYILYI